MSSIVNKVKEALNPHSSSSSGQPEGTSGPHNSRTGNAADPRVDSDRDHRAAGGIHSGTTTTGTTGTTGTHGTSGLAGSHGTTGTTGTSGLTGTHGTAGTHALGGDNRGLDGPASKTDGPHNSNLLNKVDPRIDSDRDHSKNLGLNKSGTATTGNNTHSTGHTGTTGLGSTGHTGTHTTGTGIGSTGHTGIGSTGHTGTHTTGTGIGSTGHTGTHSEGIHGPHSSRAANAADPRVDSDRDASRTVGGTTGTHGTTGLTGSHGTHGTTGLTGSHGTSGLTGTTGHTTGTGIGSTGHTGTHSEGIHGPHSSRAANAADPRVDSDRDASRTVGGTTGTHGTHGTTGLTGSHGTTGLTGSHGTHNTSGLTGSTGTHGTHNTSGLTGSTGTHGTHGTTGLTGSTHATGPAPNTAGPHKSDALNKLDPRVDSDLDGSKTNTTGNAYAHKDPTDAAQVPPSVLQKHIGPPVVEHDDHTHNREKRHSISHQEDHRGL